MLPPNEPVGDLRIHADPKSAAADKLTSQRERPANPRPHARRAYGTATGELIKALVVPGWTTLFRAFVLGFLLLVIGVVFPLFVLGWIAVERNSLFALALDDRFLLAVLVGAPAALLARFVAVTEVAVFRGRSQAIGLRVLLSFVVVAAMAIPIGFGVVRIQDARQLFDDLFPDRPSEPLYVAGGGVDDEFSTVLLIGSDAGDDRLGDRTDSMVLVMIHEESGRTGLVSIARNTERLRFPPGTAAALRWPDGFPDLANAVFPTVAADPTLHDGPRIAEVPPAAVVLARAVGHSFDVQIDDVVFTDMAGFMQLVDVFGAVTIDVEGVIPLPPNIEGATGEIPASVGPGPTEMDGPTAIAFARARSTDSDYQRMGRQRQLVAAIVSENSVVEMIWRLPEAADILRDSVVTSTSREDAARLVDALSEGQDIVESVGMAPPLVNPASMDWARARQIIDEVRTAIAAGVPSGYTPEPATDPAPTTVPTDD